MSFSSLSTRLLTELDHVRLSNLLRREGGSYPDLVDLLDNADLITSADIRADVVTMNSRVRLTDPHTGEPREITLCYPAEANAPQGRLSVLSPAGAALLGQRVGAQAQWKAPDGGLVSAQVQAILYQPEAAGDLLV